MVQCYLCFTSSDMWTDKVKELEAGVTKKRTQLDFFSLDTRIKEESQDENPVSMQTTLRPSLRKDNRAAVQLGAGTF